MRVLSSSLCAALCSFFEKISRAAIYLRASRLQDINVNTLNPCDISVYLQSVGGKLKFQWIILLRARALIYRRHWGDRQTFMFQHITNFVRPMKSFVQGIVYLCSAFQTARRNRASKIVTDTIDSYSLSRIIPPPYKNTVHRSLFINQLICIQFHVGNFIPLSIGLSLLYFADHIFQATIPSHRTTFFIFLFFLQPLRISL